MFKISAAKVQLLYDTRKFLTWEKTWDFDFFTNPPPLGMGGGGDLSDYFIS